MSTFDFLHPIRDLAKNWDIDIATCLEEYLDDLAKVTVNVNIEDKTEKLNFAEAALLIQGSSAVYARKVEYLHSLVYKTLEALTEKKNKKSKGSTGDNNDTTTDGDDISGFDIEMNFLLLDDHITTGSRYNIDLIEEETAPGSPSSLSRPSSTTGDYYDDDIELNKQNMMKNRRMSNISNISRGSQALMTSLVGDIGQNGLRLMSSEVDITGALMLPGSRAFDLANGGNGEQPTFNLNEDEAFVMQDDDEPLPNYNEETANTTSQEDPEDPWAMLDPTDAGRVKARPLKKKQTFTLPASLAGGEEEEEEDVSMSMNRTNLSMTLGANTSMNKSSFLADQDGLNFKGLAFGKEFDYVLKDQTKRSKKGRKGRGGRRVRYAEEDEEEELMINEEEFQQINDDDQQIMFDEQNVNEQQFENQFGHAGNKESEFASDPLNETKYEEKFEMLCRQHLQSFSQAAERYAAETQLSKRVGFWNKRLMPVLEAEEDREEFNIHKSAGDILKNVEGALKQEGGKKGKKKGNPLVNVGAKTVDFSLVTKDEPNYSVCRLFLSSLLLANQGNVELEHPDGDGDVLGNKMDLKLINSQMESVSMENVVM